MIGNRKTFNNNPSHLAALVLQSLAQSLLNIACIMGPPPSNIQKRRRKASSYAIPLRAIGQALEALPVEAFNLEIEGDDYLVRGWSKALVWDRLASQAGPNRDVPVVVEGLPNPLPLQEEFSGVQPSSAEMELRYSPEDVERLDEEGQERRNDPDEMPNGRSMSELLRAAGDYVDQRDARLMGISWRGQSISIVYETEEGRRELDVFSLSSMYDCWLHMCLRREAAASQVAARA